MTGHELEALDSFIVGLLTADSTLTGLLGGADRIHQEMAPEGAAEPLLIFSFVSSPDVSVIGRGTQGRIMSRPLYQFRVVTTGNSFATGSTIAGRLDTVLTGANGSVPAANLQIGNFERTEPIRYVEIAEGVRYNHIGARYRAFTSAIT